MNADDTRPKTLYRPIFNTMVEGVIPAGTEIHFVKGQIDDELTERSYYVWSEGAGKGVAAVE